MDERHDDPAGDSVPDADVTGGSSAPTGAAGAEAAPIEDLDALDGALIADRYRVAQIVSLGSNTVIVDALDTRAPDPEAHPVTLKIVRPDLAASDDFRHKFRILADLSQALTHPNISSVLDWGELAVVPEADGADSTVFWAVDAYGGGSLRDLMDRGRTLTPGQALVLGLEACRALDAAHQRGLFHTELTPSKMVFGADRRLRIVDFGMARLLAETTWEDPANVPTHVARYASPEQAIGLPIDAKTDVYALALVLVEAVTGEVPFAADSTVATLAGRVDRLLPVSADLGALAAVLERAARPEAADRYTAAEFGRALVQVAGKLPRPEPIPILSTGLFDSTASSMRRPTDPTGGVDRPAGEAADEPSAASATEQSDPDDGHVAEVAAGAAVAGGVAVAGAAAISADAPSAPDEETEKVAEDVTEDVTVDAEQQTERAEPADEPGEVEDPSTDVPSGTDADNAASVEVEPEDASVTQDEAAAADHDDDAGDDTPGDSADDGVVTAVDVDGEADAADAGDTPDDTLADAADAEPDDTLADAADAEPEGADDNAAATAALAATAGAVTQADAGDLRFTDELVASSAAPGDIVADASTGTAPMPTAVVQPAPDAAPADGPALYDDAPQKRRKGPIVLIAVVVIAGLAALGYAATLLFQPNSFAVPVLAGQPLERALNQIAGNGWEVAYERERSDSFPDADQVIRTEPEPGVDLEEGEPFVIVLSDGPEFRSLPEVGTMSFDEAASLLASLGLNATEAEGRVYSEDLNVGSVVTWQVLGNATLVAGEQILPGETIELTLSQGPEPRVVPQFGGITLDEAVARADEIQLTVVSGDGVFSDDVPEGLVVTQSPANGSLLERGGTVTVQLSLGPDVVPLPDLEGLTFTEAQVVLDEAGFVVGRLLGTTDGVFVELTIDGQEVEPGTEFRRGQVVDVIFL